MSLYKDEKSPYWWISISVNGQRIRRSTGTAIKKDAQRIHDELKADLWQRKLTGKTWHEAMILWLNAAPRDEADRYRLRAFTLPDIPLSEITAEDIERRITGAPATFNRVINLVKAVLNLAKQKGWVSEIPKFTHKSLGKTKSRVRWLTAEEWDALRDALPEHLREAAIFAISTGMRKSNVLGLEWNQIDLPRSVAWVHPDQAKAGKAIAIPLNGEAMAVLKRQIGRHPTRVFTFKGEPFDNFKSAWVKAKARAGVSDFTWHDLRHTWATWHIMSGTPLEVLQKLGGWSDPKMVQVYAHFSPGYLAQYAGNSTPVSGVETRNLGTGS